MGDIFAKVTDPKFAIPVIVLALIALAISNRVGFVKQITG